MSWMIRKRMSSEQLSECKSGWWVMEGARKLGGRPGR